MVIQGSFYLFIYFICVTQTQPQEGTTTLCSKWGQGLAADYR